MSKIETIEQLEAIYGFPAETSTIKVTDHITEDYQTIIEASPFLALATCGPEGLDCSPRGDEPGRLVRIVDSKTLHLPDRRGNNRVDSLRNIVRDARVSLMFLLPGCGNALRLNGSAHLEVSEELLKSFEVDGKPPRSVIVVRVNEVYFQCARAIVRSDLWNPARHIDPKKLPTPGQILACLSNKRVGGEEYDKAWPARAERTMW